MKKSWAQMDGLPLHLRQMKRIRGTSTISAAVPGTTAERASSGLWELNRPSTPHSNFREYPREKSSQRAGGEEKQNCPTSCMTGCLSSTPSCPGKGRETKIVEVEWGFSKKQSFANWQVQLPIGWDLAFKSGGLSCLRIQFAEDVLRPDCDVVLQAKLDELVHLHKQSVRVCGMVFPNG